MDTRKYGQITLFEYIRHCDGLDTGDIRGVARKISGQMGFSLKKEKDGYAQEKLGLTMGLSKDEKTGIFGIRLTDRKGRNMVLSTIAEVCDMLTRSLIRCGIPAKAVA